MTITHGAGLLRQVERAAGSGTNIAVLRNTRKGETIWIIASGPSLNFVPKSFFEGKVTVVVNEAMRDWPTTYAFAHHREPAQEAIDRGLTTVASEYNRCDEADGRNELRGRWFFYRHPQQPSVLVMNMFPFNDDRDDALVVGSNTVTSAMDFAGRILGAAAVILCGVDSGSIDGRWNYDGYNGGGPDVNWEEQQTRGGSGFLHVRAQRLLIETVATALRSRGVFVGSLNPFLDLGLEGHRFAR